MPAPLRALLGHPHLTALRQRRWFKPATRALAALLGVWALSWLSVPALVKGPLERLASEQLGRTVTVGSLDFKPWSLELTLRDITVAGAKGAEGQAQLTIGRVYVDAELQSLLRLAPVVDAFTVENPVLRLTHLGQGRYDVDDVIAKLAAPKDEAQTPPSTEPARLALYNLLLQGGRVDFTDNTVGKTHSVQDLLLSVPFISTLSDKKEVRVEPRLAFTLEGSRFDSSAQSTPFAQTRHADAHIRWDDLDLAPYLGYLPASLPIQLKAATLDVDVKLAFEQTPRLAVKLSGQVQTRDVKMTDREGQDLLAFDRLTVDMADVRPFEQVVNLAQVELLKPVLHAQRDAAGRLNLAQLAGGPAPASPPKEAASQPAKPSTKAAALWTVSVARASVRDGTVHWADQTTQPAAALQARGLGLELTNLALPLQKPVAFKGDFVLPAVAAQGVPEGKLAFEGEATTQNARVQITTEALALQLAAPYVAQHLEPTVAGQLTGTLGVQWQAPPADKNATGLTVTAGPLALEQLALRQNGKSLVSLGKLEVKGLQVPVDKRTVSLESLALNTPTLAVERGSDGRWMFERWAKVQAQTPTPASETTAAKAATDAPWVVRVGELALQGGAVAFADKQIVEIRIPSGKPGKDGSVALQQIAESVRGNDSTLTMVMLPRLDKATKTGAWFAALEGNGVSIQIDPIERGQLPQWIAQRLAQQDQRVVAGEEGQRTLQFFADRVEGNLLAAHQEIQKLALLHPAGELTQAQVEAAVLNVARYDVFKLSESVLAGQTARVQRMLDGLQAEGEAEVLVHWALAEDIRALKRVKDAMNAGRPLPMALRENRIWGPKERLFERILPKASDAALARLLQSAHTVDGIVKGLKQPDWPQDGWQALQRLALQVCRLTQAAR